MSTCSLVQDVRSPRPTPNIPHSTMSTAVARGPSLLVTRPAPIDAQSQAAARTGAAGTTEAVISRRASRPDRRQMGSAVAAAQVSLPVSFYPTLMPVLPTPSPSCQAERDLKAGKPGLGQRNTCGTMFRSGGIPAPNVSVPEPPACARAKCSALAGSQQDDASCCGCPFAYSRAIYTCARAKAVSSALRTVR